MNKLTLAATAGMLLAFSLPTNAASVTGMQVLVTDASTNKPVPGAAVLIRRIPENDESYSSHTNRKGLLVHLGIEPGRYLVTANVNNHKATCEIDDIDDGVVRRFNIVLDAPKGDPYCVGPHSKIFNPDETTDVYHIK